MKYLQKQTKPKGVDLAHDEIILHVEATMASQRVVRHIKETSWPGLVFLPYFLMLCVSTLVHSHMAATFLTKCLDFCRQAYFDKLYGLYFEAAGIINYEDALRVDLTKDGASSAKHISTGPWVHLFLTRPLSMSLRICMYSCIMINYIPCLTNIAKQTSYIHSL